MVRLGSQGSDRTTLRTWFGRFGAGPVRFANFSKRPNRVRFGSGKKMAANRTEPNFGTLAAHANCEVFLLTRSYIRVSLPLVLLISFLPPRPPPRVVLSPSNVLLPGTLPLRLQNLVPVLSLRDPRLLRPRKRNNVGSNLLPPVLRLPTSPWLCLLP